MNRFWIVLLTLVIPACLTHADDTLLQKQFEAIVGDSQETPKRRTVRGAAREYILGRQLASKDQHQFAIAHFRRSAEIDDLSPAPWTGLAISLSALGRDESAIAAWNEVITRDPTHKDALLILGLDAAKMGEVEKGKRYLSQHWLTQEPIALEALLRIAAMKSVFKSDSQIVELLNESVPSIVDTSLRELVPNASAPVWLGLIQQLVDLNAIDIAVQLAAKASPQLRQKELGAVLIVLPVLEAAAGGDGSITQFVYEQISLQNSIPLSPRWSEPVSLSEALSVAAQSMSIISNEKDAPIRLYNASLAIDNTNALAINNLAWIKLERDGPTEEVQKLCFKALELDSRSSYVLDTIGWLFVLLGESEKAVPILVEAVQQSREPSAETYSHLGDAYWLDKQKESAVRAWKTASMLLHSADYQQGVLEGYASMIHSVWGIAVATPEALYDSELGDLTRRLEEKLTAVQEGREPPLGFVVPVNGAH